MPKPMTPIVGADTFVANENAQVCLVRRSDNELWALPGGAQDLGETPEQCAVREFLEETGYKIELSGLIGVFSSILYKQTTNVNRGREVTHILFMGRITGGSPKTSEETTEIGWFSVDALPPLSDGHELRLRFGFDYLNNPSLAAHFE
jgi:ADP-ribose pyrophosphatase YjhB (NUDIX family)